jgi:hypothetical protein
MAFLVPHSAFWVNSAVARLVYQDYNRAGPLVTCAREQLEAHLAPLVAAAEANATAKWASGDVAGVAAVLSALAVEATAEATARWTALWMKLMVTLQDGSTAAEEPADLLCGCTKTAPVYEAAWLEKVVNDTHDHYRLPSKDCPYLDADGHCHPKAPPATTLAATPASAAMAATAPGTGLGIGAVPGTGLGFGAKGFGLGFGHGYAPVSAPVSAIHTPSTLGRVAPTVAASVEDDVARAPSRAPSRAPAHRLEPLPKLQVRGVVG